MVASVCTAHPKSFPEDYFKTSHSFQKVTLEVLSERNHISLLKQPAPPEFLLLHADPSLWAVIAYRPRPSTVV
ncbi:hypothetical protein CapIbe_013851 [Capra ibex]